MPVRAEVELDIFSGMPNPSWTLTKAEAEVLIERIGALSPTSAREFPGHLGYRGFIVHLNLGGRETVLRIQDGAVQVSEAASQRYVADQGRALERWLFCTGRPYIRRDVAEIAERALR